MIGIIDEEFVAQVDVHTQAKQMWKVQGSEMGDDKDEEMGNEDHGDKKNALRVKRWSTQAG